MHWKCNCYVVILETTSPYICVKSKLWERKVKTVTRNWRDHERDRHTQTHGNWIEIFRLARPEIVCPLEWMATDLLPTVPTTCPFLWQSILDLTISPLIPVGMYGYSITCPLTLTKSLATILNLHTNSFYLLDSVLALISDNFPPCIPLATPWWHLS